MTSKIDYLQKYLNSKSSKGNKKKKSKKNERAETKNITIVNDNLDVIHDTEEIGDGEYDPVIVEDMENSSGDEKPVIVDQSKIATSSGWIDMEGLPVQGPQKPSEQYLKRKRKESEEESSSDEGERRGKKRHKRHDTDSDDGEADPLVSFPESNISLRIDSTGDIEVPRGPVSSLSRPGLHSAVSLKHSIKEHKQHIAIERAKNDLSGGPNIQTIYRDSDGRKQTINKRGEIQSKRDELIKINEEQISKWGRGIKQLEEEEERKRTEEERMNEPFARYEVTSKRDEEMQRKERFGDPMLKLKKGEKGKNIGTISRSKCKFEGTSNRFNIQPGERWDGVDRANGYEKQYLQRQIQRKNDDQERYKWRTQEM